MWVGKNVEETMIKLKVEISGIELAAKVKEGMKPNLPWYYGFSYFPANKFGVVYHIIPLNYLAKSWYWLKTWRWRLLLLLITFEPTRKMVAKWYEKKGLGISIGEKT